MIGGNGSIFTSGQNQPRLSVANLDSLLKPEKKELEFLKPVLESQSAMSDNHSGVDIFAKDKPAPTQQPQLDKKPIVGGGFLAALMNRQTTMPTS